jgi:hypothetical protein
LSVVPVRISAGVRSAMSGDGDAAGLRRRVWSHLVVNTRSYSGRPQCGRGGEER